VCVCVCCVCAQNGSIVEADSNDDIGIGEGVDSLCGCQFTLCARMDDDGLFLFYQKQGESTAQGGCLQSGTYF